MRITGVSYMLQPFKRFLRGQSPRLFKRLLVPVSTACVAAALSVASSIAYSFPDSLETPAFKSDMAKQSLLLDASRTGEGNRVVVVGERGHILFTDDDGRHWAQANVPVMSTITATHFVSMQKGWAVGHDAVILKTIDGGKSWVKQYDDVETEVPLLDVWFQNDRVGIAVGAFGYFIRTEDGGETWNQIENAIDNEDEFHYNAITMVGGDTLLMVGEYGTLYRSSDFGASWENITDRTPYEGSFFGVIGTQSTGTVLAYGLRGNLYRSHDAGDTWEQVQSHTEASLVGGAVLDDGSIVIVGGSGVVLKSYDGGRSFTTRIRRQREPLTAVSPTADGNLVVVGADGIHLVLPNGTDLDRR